jgi:MEMO1 family protein
LSTKTGNNLLSNTTEKPVFFSLLLLWIFLACLLSAGPILASEIRYPVWAGCFYPADKDALRENIKQLTAQVPTPATAFPDGKLRALILPHAGFIYSGLTSAHASLVLHEGQFRKIIMLGPDHRIGFTNGAISDMAGYRTPLGEIPIHHTASQLRMYPQLSRESASSDHSEHSLEVVLPFLQYYLGSFELIPIVLGPSNPAEICSAIAPHIDTDTLFVVSSDLSHYLPYAKAAEKDRITINHILNLEGNKLIPGENMACGICALKTIITLARRNSWHPKLLHYSNSGDTAGNKDRVVGYAAIGFFADQNNHVETNHDPAD